MRTSRTAVSQKKSVRRIVRGVSSSTSARTVRTMVPVVYLKGLPHPRTRVLPRLGTVAMATLAVPGAAPAGYRTDTQTNRSVVSKRTPQGVRWGMRCAMSAARTACRQRHRRAPERTMPHLNSAGRWPSVRLTVGLVLCDSYKLGATGLASVPPATGQGYTGRASATQPESSAFTSH